MSSKALVICLPRTPQTRFRCLEALICSLIERDCPPTTSMDRLLVWEVCDAVRQGEALPEDVELLPANARHALISGAYQLLADRHRPGEIDVWLDWCWRALTHPEEFPLMEGGSIKGAKTSVDQRNCLSSAICLLDMEKFREVEAKLRELEMSQPEDYTLPPMPPF